MKNFTSHAHEAHSLTVAMSLSSSCTGIDDKLHRSCSYAEQVPQRSRRKLYFCCKLISSILIPLMIGVFTLITTMRELDSSRQARENDLTIAVYHNEQDKSLAEELRQENVFDQYLRDIAELVQTKAIRNLTENDFILARAKTLTTFRQINIRRKEYLIEFLYENQLIKTNSLREGLMLDLNGLNLNNLTFHSSASHSKFKKSLNFRFLCLKNVLLINASFTNIDLSDARFESSILSHSNFSHTKLKRANFANCVLDHADFTDTLLVSVNFTGANVNQSNISLSGSGNILTNMIFPNGTHQATLIRQNLLRNGNKETCSATNSSSTTTRRPVPNPAFPPLARPQTGSGLNHWYEYLPKKTYLTMINGRCMFASQAQLAKLKRELDVTHYAFLIDAHRAQYDVSAFLGSTNGNQSNAYSNLKIYFYKSNDILSQVSLGFSKDGHHPNSTAYQQWSSTGLIPRETRLIQFVLTFHQSSIEQTNLPIANDIQFDIETKID
ncbi:hypothetical protein I4U23_011243 [Adineta vaga]|nr:hypothetical protein I4U23_011243 [Adineta vaga]